MARRVDIVNKRFGRLVVLAFERYDQHRKSVWRCLCDCGQESKVAANALRQGLTRSCGCLRAEHARAVGQRSKGVRLGPRGPAKAINQARAMAAGPIKQRRAG
jgi:hypothetical protein